MSIVVAHRTASGSIDQHWEFDAKERRIHVAMREGNAYLAFSVAVCAPDSPRIGAHPIMRLDGESWRVLPSRFVRTWPDGIEQLEPMTCPIANSLNHGVALVLTNAPPDVDAQLMSLGL